MYCSILVYLAKVNLNLKGDRDNQLGARVPIEMDIEGNSWIEIDIVIIRSMYTSRRTDGSEKGEGRGAGIITLKFRAFIGVSSYAYTWCVFMCTCALMNENVDVTCTNVRK